MSLSPTMPPQPNWWKFWLVGLTIAAGILLVVKCSGEEARLVVEARTNETVLYIVGGETNTQYQIFTAADYKVPSSQWDYWRHAYSTSFKANAEIRIQGANVVYRPARFFRLGGVLPD